MISPFQFLMFRAMPSRVLLATVMSLFPGYHLTTPSTSPNVPWKENLLRLAFPGGNHSLLDGLPDGLLPFLNQTALKQLPANFTENDVITDEDIADDHGDDEHPQINTAKYDGKTTTITISTEAGLELFQHWVDQAVSGLMATVATKKLQNVPEVQKAAHHTCAKTAKTVVSHAKCVVALIDFEIKYQQWNAKKAKLGKYHKPNLLKYKKSAKELEKQIPSDEDRWLGSFKMRAKRSLEENIRPIPKPLQGEHYTLLDEKKLSPVALLAKKLTETVRTFKNKDKQFDNWQNIVAEIKQEGKKLKKKREFKKMLEDRFDLFKQTLQDEGIDRSLMKKMDVLGDEVFDDATMQKANRQERKATDDEKMMRIPMKLIREGIFIPFQETTCSNCPVPAFIVPGLKLGMVVSGKNATDIDKKNIKLMSPRLFSLVPEEIDEETINLLSPSLLSLHRDGKGLEDELSLSKSLKNFDDQGHQEWLNFVIEASGVSDAVKSMKEANAFDERRRYDEEFRGKDGRPLYFTKENVTEMYGAKERAKIDVFEQLQKSLTPQQVGLPNSTTYQTLLNVSAEEIPRHIDHTIRELATETIAFKARRDDVVLMPLAFTSVVRDPVTVSQPIILSPLLFVPVILSPAIFGPMILSPWAFVPVLVSPRILSPLILNPLVLSPIILSPLALHPLILSPGALDPFILSPLVLSPFIINPVALSPLILSPFCLSPFIIVPNVLSPLILSPFVLSPLILATPAVSAFILTPYALSPVIGPGGVLFAASTIIRWLKNTKVMSLCPGYWSAHTPAVSMYPNVPWKENLVRLAFPGGNRSLLEELPDTLLPFLNQTALKQLPANFTESDVITDEDVADDHGDDEHPQINTAKYDGKTTTITVSTEAGLQNVPEVQKAAHHTCAKAAKTVVSHAKCVVALIDFEINWQKIVSEAKLEGEKIKKKRKFKKMLEERLDLFKETLQEEGVDRSLMKRLDVLGDDDFEAADKMMYKAKREEKKMTTDEKIMRIPMKLIREGVKLGMVMSGRNATDVDKKNIKLMSPRLFSLVPDEIDEEINLLSPSLLSLHKEGRGLEDELSLAKSLKYFDEQGHQEWLNFVIEASGKANEDDEVKRFDEEHRGQDGQPLYFTKENVTQMYGPSERAKIEVFEHLQKSLTPQQMLAMNTTGYAVMDKEQLQLVYGPGSPFSNSTTYQTLLNVSANEIPRHIDHTIRELAKETIAFKTRREQFVLMPLSFTSLVRDPVSASQPLILSPILFVPVIFSPAIFGPVILSPWAFVPVLVSPRLLSPVILSPIVLSPVILSPLALDPLILSPGALVPFVLSPFVLSPFIINPVALSPLILSPFCLSPFIIVPNVLSPLILSPFVLSPLILATPAVSAFILTPYALSPVIGPNGVVFAAVLSPSWLS
ncbi:unnamed protein product [Nippostrongylus brasiliensis]|uniref:SUN domain-containing protein n=1 Tax=Nippostrongylus brasiliensis TaxID=27835 RepID=A0A158R0H8_NIPBR|nr:unnamed protein product [Nippostrongylus brasiliensis]